MIKLIAGYLKNAKKKILLHPVCLRRLSLKIINNKAKINILILHHVSESNLHRIPKTVLHNLDSFGKYSKYNIHYLHFLDLLRINIDLYGAVIFHYYSQVYTTFPDSVVKKLQAYRGKKVFFAQDDYDYIWRNRKKYLDCKIDHLYTPVNDPNTLEFLYPRENFGHIKIHTYLTGYYEAGHVCSLQIQNIKDRGVDIFYRGNDVGLAYGSLGQEKYEIGVKLKSLLANSHLSLDISCSIRDQIYGDHYYVKMKGAKATLITETGSSIIFDDPHLMEQRNQLISLFRSNKKVTIEKLKFQYPEFFELEGKYAVAVISPKVFEAITCKTALIGFKGHYSGVLVPGEHYIVLNKDFSNLDEVVQKLSDTHFLQKMVDKTYKDIYLSGLYSYQKFIEKFENDLFG